MKHDGFTLTETIVSLAIVAALLAIILPTLSIARSRAQDVKSLSNLRSHAQSILAYTGDNSDSFPCLTEPGALTTLGSNPFPVGNLRYFELHRAWHIALAPIYYDSGHTSEVFRSPQSKANDALDVVFTDYFYPCSYIASPAYWIESSRRTGSDQLVGTSAYQVRYPASKSLVIESEPFLTDVRTVAEVQGTPLPMAFVDGSSSETTFSERITGYRRGDGYENLDFGTIHFNNFLDGLHTIGGVEGRDVTN